MDINKIIKNLESSNKENNNLYSNESMNESMNKNKNKNMNKNINYNPKVFITSCTGLKIWWLLGLYDSFRSQNINIQDNIFLTYSASAFATAIYLSDISGKKFIQKSINLFEEKYGKWDSIFLGQIADIIKPLLEDILPNDCHLKCSNRLHIMYYNFPFTFETVSQFSSKEDLIDHLIMCSYMPFLTNNIKNNNTLSDTYFGLPNNTIYNFIDYNIKDNINIHRFYYWELHKSRNIFEKINYFYFCDKHKLIKMYNYGVEDSNIYIYKYDLGKYKNKVVHTYLSKEIYKTKKFKIKKLQKNFHIFRSIIRYITIITTIYILIYYVLKIIAYYIF